MGRKAARVAGRERRAGRAGGDATVRPARPAKHWLMTLSSSLKTADGRVSAAVRVNGKLRPAPTDFPADAIFPIYSITKTLTAICVLRLVETGSLRLADAARQWLPDLRIPTTITLTHLLRHTSGLRDYGPLPEYHEAVRTCPDRPWTRQQFLDAVLSQGMLFASVLEQVADLMRCVPGFGSEVTSDGHIVDVRGRYHPGWCAPRLIASTAEDITRVFDGLIAGDVLELDTLTQMLTLAPLSDEPDEIHSGGMGVYADRSSGRGRNYHHGGGGPGYDLSATVYPDTPLGRISIAVFVNSSCGPRANDCEATLLGRLLDQNL
jgi:D-alanyl-D-alanine carboxypeptidase